MVQESILTIIASILAAAATAIGAFVIQEKKWQNEFKTEFMAEHAVKKLLMHEKWKQRSFEEIDKKIGGFEQNELRKLLVRSGAVRFYDPSGNEFWGLISRNQDRLE